ncbi:hypothetical protein G6O69_13870 [Pseudenhygromyxa sp. WMMC2535]|uniref:GIDE domain-containing protein n=1 Tax=Pseudenhygromyxa sp. WMMC2535 TaxID=2712867 RepID=UPI00155770B0|nr:hypothetical protein [Pseudenhygromyxa sp. WMMC2535]NVB38924.1 hypothetical protein [Pseudenhygromyxa sp. WMMC2535]
MLLAPAIALTVAAALLGAGAVHLRRRKARSFRAIAELRPGWAEVRGRALVPVHVTATTTAPISGREGIGWRVVIEQESGVHGWQTIVRLSNFIDFELEDASGRITVCAANSPVALEAGETRGRGGPFDPLPRAVQRLIIDRASAQGVLFHKGFRWREWVLEAGRVVRVRGRVIQMPGEISVSYRALGERLVLAGGAQHPVEICE